MYFVSDTYSYDWPLFDPQLSCTFCHLVVSNLHLVFFLIKISSIGIKIRVARGHIQDSPLLQWTLNILLPFSHISSTTTSLQDAYEADNVWERPPFCSCLKEVKLHELDYAKYTNGGYFYGIKEEGKCISVALSQQHYVQLCCSFPLMFVSMV